MFWLFFRPTLDPKDPNLTGAFSGALTAALDVMAFTHDIDINTTSGNLEMQNKVGIKFIYAVIF